MRDTEDKGWLCERSCEENQPWLTKSQELNSETGSMGTEEKYGNHSDRNEAPDGGWGWMVVLAVFVGNLLIDGVVGCFGLLYPEILKEFSASPSVTSMAGSMSVGIYLFSSKYKIKGKGHTFDGEDWGEGEGRGAGGRQFWFASLLKRSLVLIKTGTSCI